MPDALLMRGRCEAVVRGPAVVTGTDAKRWSMGNVAATIADVITRGRLAHEHRNLPRK